MWISSPLEGNYVHLPSTLEIWNESRRALPLVRMEEALMNLTMFKTVAYLLASNVYPGKTVASAKLLCENTGSSSLSMLLWGRKKNQQASSSSPTGKRREGQREEMFCDWISTDLQCGVEVALLWPTNTEVLVCVYRYRTLRVLK